MKRLDSNTEAIIAHYVKDIRSLPNESAKVARFQLLIGELFSGSAAITTLSSGVEKAIRIDRPKGESTGFIDSYYGNAVIEFEKSLKATGHEAQRQLKEYCAGIWSTEGRPFRRLLAIASDGLNWQLYLPGVPPNFKGKPKQDDVRLDLIREFTVANDTLADFYFWLNGLLFRSGQIAPTAPQFRNDFGRESVAYTDALESLRAAWRKSRTQSEPALAFENWQRYLTVTYGSLPTVASAAEGATEISDLEELFLKHTYLASIARVMIWASVSEGKSSKGQSAIANDVLSGDYFRSRNLDNVVEDDFFHWVRDKKADDILNPTWEKVIEQIQTYDLSLLDQDVLKGVYQELVDPKDRHELGEYYTPDWLCERIVAELLPNTGYVSVLDPTCGSGGFLRATITHLRRVNASDGREAQLKHILESVMGIDVHPLAVTIAKATYILALGDLVKAAKRPIQIPVYMADSLFLPAEVKQLKLGEGTTFQMRFGGKTLTVPESLITSTELFDPSISAASKVAMDHAQTKKEKRATLAPYLLTAVPALSAHPEREDIIDALWLYVDALAELIRARKNSIWAFIIRNSYRPAMLRQRFDFIVGNPPWIVYRSLSDPDYQDEVKKRALNDYRIAPKEMKLFTHMELATIFLAHAMYWFAKDGARIGFVMPRSILSADQHHNFRVRNYSWRASFRLTSYWDLLDVSPLFNVPSCVVFAERADEYGKAEDPVPAREWSGSLKDRDSSWQAAKDSLAFEERTARVIYLGKHSALSTHPGSHKASLSSSYAKLFRQGATILPRSFYFVRVKDHEGKIAQDSLYWAETDPEQAVESKKPWDDVSLAGQIEGRYFFHSALSRHVLPFVLLDPALVVLPISLVNNRPVLLSTDELKTRGDREFAKWMKKVESIWLDKRKKKADKETATEWLDYQLKLTKQNLGLSHVVLYNAAGTNVSAAYFNRNDGALPFIVEHKLYWAAFPTAEEALYLTALLNSETANQRIKPFQSMGLMGERDIEKKLLDLPIPSFDKNVETHVQLAQLGLAATSKASEIVKHVELPGALWKRRELIRNELDDVLSQIDSVCAKIL